MLLDINYTLFGPADRHQDRLDLFDRASDLGWAERLSDSQVYLLTAESFLDVRAHLRMGLRPTDLVKLQEVMGQFCVEGYFPPGVNSLLEFAEEIGVLTLAVSRQVAMPSQRIAKAGLGNSTPRVGATNLLASQVGLRR